MKKITLTLGVGVTIFAGLISLSFTGLGDRYFEIAKNLDIFTSLFREINTHYVDEIQPEEIINEGINAMLSSLDPYSAFIPEDKVESYRVQTTGHYGGIGTQVELRGDRHTIVMSFKEYPAYEAGLQIGDEVLKIDGTNMLGAQSDKISNMLKGKVNTPVTLTIQRYGFEKPFDVPLIRAKIIIRNVPYSGIIKDRIGYIYLSDFTPNAGNEVRQALIQLKEQQVKSVVLDLRGNLGGLLTEAVNVSNIFVNRSSIIVSTKSKNEASNKIYRADQNPEDTHIPLVVLVNGGTASAAEIVSGVIQDYDRGVLIGTKTYGKGLVQSTRPLVYNSQLKITTAKYYIPSGRCIQAIDYSHRSADGSIARIPDSLRVAFKTTAGRVVYDGGGVNPDLPVDEPKLAPISVALFNKNHIFDYATHYHFHHKAIAPARQFSLSEAEYKEFETWLASHNLEYSGHMEGSIQNFIASAKKEKYYHLLESELAGLQKLLVEMKKTDLSSHKSEIKQILEREIISRYYLVEGLMEYSFQNDPLIQEAVDLLNDIPKYRNILSIN